MQKSETMDLEQLRTIYDEVELAILFDWFGVERPDPLREVQLEIYGENEFPADAEGRVRLMGSDGGYSDENALSNAVARLVLSEIQGRLPQWGVAYGDGSVNLARTYAPRRDAAIDFMPRFLVRDQLGGLRARVQLARGLPRDLLAGLRQVCRHRLAGLAGHARLYGRGDRALWCRRARRGRRPSHHRGLVGWTGRRPRTVPLGIPIPDRRGRRRDCRVLGRRGVGC